MRYVSKIKGMGFLLWHARHEFYHTLLGLIWAWVLREAWNEFSVKWLILSISGSLLPDLDHLFYYFTYGKKDDYTKNIRQFFKDRQWRNLATFIEEGHKFNTNLSYHNIYFTLLLFVVAFVCLLFDWKAWVVLFGAMIFHFLLDILDDYVSLGYLNDNWKRWGRSKKTRRKLF